MPQIDTHAIGLLLGPFFLWFFFIFGLIGFAVGTSLVVCGSGMTKFSDLMNRWVSTRSKLGRRWIGALFIAGGAYPLFKLAGGLHSGSLGLIGTGGTFQGRILASGIEAAWWFLTVGNLFAIAFGMLLLLAPRVLDSLATKIEKGTLVPKAEGGEGRMYLTLDHLVGTHPRLAGSLVAAGAFVVVLQFGSALFGANR
ncbi:MAG: hypothetical protein M0P39_01810 [Rhodocyclaceae bacterium]|nr:hypothetical protein [Rhodocyclaceae bacterium]